MENHLGQNAHNIENPMGIKNHVMKTCQTDGIGLKNEHKDQNGDINHQDDLFDSNLKIANLNNFNGEDNRIEELLENKRGVRSKVDLVDTFQNSMDVDSSDSDDLFTSSKKVTKSSNENKQKHSVTIKTHSAPIKSNLNGELSTHESLEPLDGIVANVTKRIEPLKSTVTNSTDGISDSNCNISSAPHVIQPSATNDLNQDIPSENNLNNNNKHSENETSDLKPFPNSSLSHIVEKVNSLNLNVSPKVVFHTPHTTPLKLKLNSLPVQSHPLDDHALNGLDDPESFRNEPLDFPTSPVLNKCMDEICLKRYKRCEPVTPSSKREDSKASGGRDKEITRPSQMSSKVQLNCVKAKEANCLKSQQPNCSHSTGPQQMSAMRVVTQPHPSLEGRTSPGAAFTNNVSAESYLKKYDDINAQVRAYLNKTQSSQSTPVQSCNNHPSDLDALNARSHRYLHSEQDASPSSDLRDAIRASSKVTYASDDEDTSLYDTVVTQDCHGVKLVKHARKPTSLPTGSGGETKKKLLTADLFSGNLLDDDLQSLSDEDIDELLSPVDDALENSILEQLNLSDEDAESIQELSAQEEREEGRRWRVALVNGVEKRIDMKVIEPYKRVLSHGGYLSEGCHNAIIVFSACFLPHHSRADYHYVMDNLFFYVLHTLDQLVTEDYVLVYLHGATSRHNMPTFAWLKRCYQMIDRKLKKNLKQLYLVHATFWLKTIVVMSKPFISAKFSRKIRFVLSLNELQERLPIEEASIPDKVKQYDKIKLSMSRTE